MHNYVINRKTCGNVSRSVFHLPNLLKIQLSSYEAFLQREKVKNHEPLENQGLQQVFSSIFPIESPNGDVRLEYERYVLDENGIKYSEDECREKQYTYAIPLKARINLVFLTTGEIRQKEIYMGEIPLMTEAGSFIVNGAERVVVSQMHRSPGVIFFREKDGYFARIIPYQGSWLEFEVDAKKNIIYIKIDKKKKILATVFLRALGFDTREKILRLFCQTKSISLVPEEENTHAVGQVVLKPQFSGYTRLLRSGDKLYPHKIDTLLAAGITEVEVLDIDHPASIRSLLILNCFEYEEAKYFHNDNHEDLSKEEAVAIIADVLSASDAGFVDNAERELLGMFFSPRRYSLGKVGRYKLNQKFDYEDPPTVQVLTKEDISSTLFQLIRLHSKERPVDDIDHLGNRRVRSVGELLEVQLKSAFSNIERIARSRMELRENDTIKPQDLIAIKYVVSAVKDFFGSSQLAQFMDQVNPLAEITHKRRLNSLGPGGVVRERAGSEIRDVHYTHYGRMCPIETPEGPNIGLIVSLANYAQVNEFGFLETPYREVKQGVVTDNIQYLSAADEEKYNIAQSIVPKDENGNITADQISARNGGDYVTCSPKEVHFMDVSPQQTVSISAALIPFLEHDDANRALMGSNMQRQAVPLLFPEPPRVGTGMESVLARDSGTVRLARQDGTVVYASAEKIIIHDDKKNDHTYQLLKYYRTNQDTCCVQKPIVAVGSRVTAGDPIADGAATYKGELALGKNVFVGFIPWNGYNFEDAILISERLVKEEAFTSIHVHEFVVEVRETKFGPESITSDIPNTPERSRAKLDENGVVYVGARINYGDILVGKVTPKSNMDNTPEFRLLNQIFGEKAREVRDTSLRVPHGVEGTIISVKSMDRSDSDDLSPGVIQVLKVVIATKRTLKEGDKMAGRHGNKGVIARILPEEDMPFLEDGTPLDLCLNPLGVPSRMNVGQILETQLGWTAVFADEWLSVPVFESIAPSQIEERLESLGLPANSKVTLYDGRTGEVFQNPVTVGYMYVMKLHHLVDDKMHARSTGPYSLVTQQPLGGKAQFGGQRLGEMEVWALEAYGAANVLQEFLTIKSDDLQGRTKIYEAIVKGELATEPGIPESFHVLMQELRGLGLDMTIFDAKDKPVALTERDREILAQDNSVFN